MMSRPRLTIVALVTCGLLAWPAIAQLELEPTPTDAVSPTDYEGLTQLWASRGAATPHDRTRTNDGGSLGDLVPYADLVEAFFNSATWRYTVDVLEPGDRLFYWKMVNRMGIRRRSEAERILTTAVEQFIATTPTDEKLHEINAQLYEEVGVSRSRAASWSTVVRGTEATPIEWPTDAEQQAFNDLYHAREIRAAGELGELYRWLVDHLEATGYPEHGIRGYIFGNVSVGIATDEPLERFLEPSRAFDLAAFGKGGER